MKYKPWKQKCFYAYKKKLLQQYWTTDSLKQNAMEQFKTTADNCNDDVGDDESDEEICAYDES